MFDASYRHRDRPTTSTEIIGAIISAEDRICRGRARLLEEAIDKVRRAYVDALAHDPDVTVKFSLAVLKPEGALPAGQVD